MRSWFGGLSAREIGDHRVRRDHVERISIEGDPLAPSAIATRIRGEERTMPSVSCKITSKTNPQKWIEVEIGVDDRSGDNFWRLTARSTVAFPQFHSTSGRWDPIPFSVRKPSGGFSEVPSILLFSGDPDPRGGFILFNPGPSFYRLGCGQVLRGEGAREGPADLTYRMDFLCV
jgi:hypothetical protein